MEYYSNPMNQEYTILSSSSEEGNVVYEPVAPLTFTPVTSYTYSEPIISIPVQAVQAPIMLSAPAVSSSSEESSENVQSYLYQPTSTSTTEFQLEAQTWSGIEDWKGEKIESTCEEKCMLVSKPSEIASSSYQAETITVAGETGLWMNKRDEENWSGPVALSEYPINKDSKPEIIHKRSEQELIYTQEITIRYLKPPELPQHGEIHIKEEHSILPPLAPPIVIRQQPPRPETPPPLVLREKPPKPPPTFDKKVIMIPAKRLPPPPRRVVVERLAPLPQKPQSIIVERWLAYKEHKRKVVFTKAPEVKPHAKQHNTIIQWESPKVCVKRVLKDLGVIRANPSDYIQRFGDSLKRLEEFPDFLKSIRPPSNLLLATEAEHKCELEGDLFALRYIDMDREGLSHYKACLSEEAISSSQRYETRSLLYEPCKHFESIKTSSEEESQVESHFNQIIDSMRVDKNLGVTWEQAKQVLKQLNEKLCRTYDESKCERFLERINPNRSAYIDYCVFKNAVLKAQ